MNQVCGIIVTFNPDDSVVNNIGRVISQLDCLLVVDNGSRPGTLAPIREASPRLGFELIELGRNYGIAAALNRGVERAKALHAGCVVLFDQDSTADPGLIAALIETYDTGSANDKVAIVFAKHIKRDTNAWMKPDFGTDGGVLAVITSGSLIPLTIFDDCGPFEEDLIIDGVDQEFCLRVRTLGYRLLLCEEGVLWVTLGSPKPFRVFGITLFRAPHYSPGRRYYSTRNRLVIIKRYWKLYPAWCYWCVKGIAKDLIMVLVAEDSRLQKLRSIALGVRDALRNRMGMIVPL